MKHVCERCGAPRKPQAGAYCSKACELADRKEPHIIARRFWPNVNKDGSCWLWTGSKNARGYGLISVQGRSNLAPRIAWFLTNGPIAYGMQVLHRCDNPPCVNPDHLFIGTPADNYIDMVNKGRLNPARGNGSGSRRRPDKLRRGETSGMSKLTDDLVRTIRTEHAKGTTVADLARRLGLAHNTVRQAALRETWKHVV